MKRLWILLGLAVALMCGCGGAAMRGTTAAEATQSSGGASGPAASPAPGAPSTPTETETASLDRSAPPPPPVSGATSDAPKSSAPAPAAKERPGLGTEWGEQRVSRVHDVAFVRADEDRAFAVATLHYNDRSGVQALASFQRTTGPRLRETAAGGGAISVAIHDGAGESLEAVHLGDRTLVIGEQGQRYTIVLTNHTAHRFEAVATVDGLDVINGKPGTMQNRGYVLMPFATLEIDGFRQSHDTVAAFRFARVADSYAAQTGSARNVGVIGVAFFAEQGDEPETWTADELHRRDTASPFPADSRFAQPPRR